MLSIDAILDKYADVMELVDMRDSKSLGLISVSVRIGPSVQKET